MLDEGDVNREDTLQIIGVATLLPVIGALLLLGNMVFKHLDDETSELDDFV